MVDTFDQRESDVGFGRLFHLFEHRATFAFVTTEILLFALAWATLAAFDGELANVFYGIFLSVGILGGLLGVVVGVLAVLSRF